MFSTLPKTNFNFSATFVLSPATAFNLDQPKNFLFGKELNPRDCVVEYYRMTKLVYEQVLGGIIAYGGYLYCDFLLMINILHFSLCTLMYLNIPVSCHVISFHNHTLIKVEIQLKICIQFNPFQNKPLFLRVCSTSFLKTLIRYEQFLLFPKCFLPVWRTFCHFHQI